jgi:hypothetical protein
MQMVYKECYQIGKQDCYEKYKENLDLIKNDLETYLK